MEPYFQCDGITLYLADSREVLPQLEAEPFGAVITDPPYLVGYTGRWGTDREAIHGDSDPSWVYPIYSDAWRLLKPNSLCLSFYGWPHADTFLGTWKMIGFRPVSLIALIKDRWGLGTQACHGLPPITYRSGGLEQADVRKIVCEILEGGEAAFRDRARRLRIALAR